MRGIILLIIIAVLIIALAIVAARSIIARGYIGGGRDKLMQHKRAIPIQEFSLKDSVGLLDNKFVDAAIKESPTCVLYSDIPTRLPYMRSTRNLKTTIHIGQLKLFLTELEFLTDYLDSSDDPAFVIYAGSSPSNKIAQLADMFPAVKFILVDPHEHYVMYPGSDQYSDEHVEEFLYFVAAEGDRYSLGTRRINFYSPDGPPVITPRGQKIGAWPLDIARVVVESSSRYFMIEDYMDMSLAGSLAALASHGRVLFISDIRTLNEDEGQPTDLHILWNSAMMLNWLGVLRPAAYMLKFHTPYFNQSNIEQTYALAPYMHADFERSRVDFLADYLRGEFNFLRADKIYLQAFAGPTSSETRHVGTTLDIAPFDSREYEDKLFFHNRITRPFGWHTSHERYLDSVMGIDRCGDCALMCHIFEAYARKFGKSDAPAKINGWITRLLKTIKRGLVSPESVHGLYYIQYPDRKALHDIQEGLIALQIVRKIFKQAHARIKRASAIDVYNRLRALEKLDAELAQVTLAGKKSGGQLLYNSLKIGDVFGFSSEEFRTGFLFKAVQFLPEPAAANLTTAITNIMTTRDDPGETPVGGTEIKFGKYTITNRAPELPLNDALAATVFEKNVAASIINSAEWLSFVADLYDAYGAKMITTITTTPIHKIETGKPTQALTLYNCAVNWLEENNIEGDIIIIRLPQVSDFVRRFIGEFMATSKKKFIFISGLAKQHASNLTQVDEYVVEGVDENQSVISMHNINPRHLEQSAIKITQRIQKNKICWSIK